METSKWSERLDSAIRFFFYVLIFWLPYSPAVVESCVITALILWIIKRCLLIFSGRTFWDAVRPRRTFLDKPIVVFLFVCVVSIFSSALREQAVHGFITKTLEWFVIYYLVLEAFTKKRHIYIVLSIWMFTAFSTAVDGIVQYYYITHRDFFHGYGLVQGVRVTAGFHHSNSLAAFLTVVIPATLSVCLFNMRKLWMRFLSVALLVIFIWTFILTFSRAAWLSMLLGVLIFFILYIRNRKPSAAVVILICATLIAGVGGFQKLKPKMNLSLKSRGSTISYRLGVWEDTLKMIAEQPMFGHGLNTYMRLFQHYRRKYNDAAPYSPTYAHNCYLQMASEIGILGLLSFLWLLFRLFRNVLKAIGTAVSAENERIRTLMIGLFSGISTYLVHSFFDTNLYSLQLSVYFWFIVGIIISSYYLLSAKENAPDEVAV